MEQELREAGLPPCACAVTSGRAAESPGWEEREWWAGREPRLRRRSTTLVRGPPYLRGLDPGQSGAAVAERRSEPSGPDSRERPSCEEVSGLSGRGGLGRRVRQASPAGGGVPPSCPVTGSPCADCLVRPGLRLPRPGVRTCAAFASRLPAFPRCPGRAGRSFPFRSPCRPLPLPAFSRPASLTPLRLPPAASLNVFSRSLWLAGAGRVKAETAPRLGGPGFSPFPADSA